MTFTETPKLTPVPPWTHEQLSALFWHHHRRSLVASGLATLAALACAVMVVIDKPVIGLVFAPASLIMTAIWAWHRARASLLGQLRFPLRDGDE